MSVKRFYDLCNFEGPMSTLREVIRCQHCRLNQFAQGNRLCKRCKGELGVPLHHVVRRPRAGHEAARVKPVPATVAERVVGLRTKSKLSQCQLAKLIDCPRTWISKIENGRCHPQIATVQRLALAFGVSITELLPIAPESSWADPELVEFMQAMADHVVRLNEAQIYAVLLVARKLRLERIRELA